MARKRFIVPWTGSEEKPAIYHCVSRVVDRRFALEQKDKEQFRTFMRMYEKFTGCRVLTYCLMCNHIHLLVEVTPRPAGPMTDEELLRRYRAISSPMAVRILRNELKEAREKLAAGLVNEEFIEKIHARYTWNGGGKRHGKIHDEYRAMLLIEGVERFQKVSDERADELRLKLERKGMSKADVDAEMRRLEAGRGVAIAKRLQWRLRYLSDGAVIGQRSFVDEVFRQCRDQFGPKRKDGARRMRGDAADLTKTSGIWSLRDIDS